MDARALTVLEFPKIRERLAERTAFAASRGLALDLEPSAGRRAIETGLNETSEARLLLELQADFSVRAAHDVRPVVQRALVGAVLDPPALQEVRDTLESALYVRGVLNSPGRPPAPPGRAGGDARPLPHRLPGDQGEHRGAGGHPGQRLARAGQGAGAAAHGVQPPDGRPAADHQQQRGADDAPGGPDHLPQRALRRPGAGGGAEPVPGDRARRVRPAGRRCSWSPWPRWS